MAQINNHKDLENLISEIWTMIIVQKNDEVILKNLKEH